MKSMSPLSLSLKKRSDQPKETPKKSNGGTIAKTSPEKSSAKKTISLLQSFVKGNKQTPIKIVATIDIGFGNYLYIRGDGCGLSWDKGTVMTPIDDKHWEWESGDKCAQTRFEFKLLINDEIWSTGENYVAIGTENEITPSF